MTDPLTTRPRVAAVTWLGLFLALFGMLLIRQGINFFWPTPTTTSVILREALMWVNAAALLIITRRGEHLPLRSVGLGTARWWKSILWGWVIAALCLVVALALAHLTGYGHGPGASAFEKLPLWLITLIVLRAGVVEELCYRGYAIERLQVFGLKPLVAAAIPLVIFGVGHWTGGAANILIALVLGAILAGFYLWRRDLAANMCGHFLVDFLANVLPRLLS